MKYKRSVYRTFALITQLGLSMITPIFFVRFFLRCFLEKKVLHFTVYPIGDHGCAGRRTQHILLGKTCK